MAITVAGAGPGDKKYVLPAVVEEIKKSSTVAVSERIRKDLGEWLVDKKIIPLGSGTPLEESLRRILQEEDVLVLVSGDPLFYSLLKTLKKRRAGLKVLPGISSLQYLFAKTGYSLEEARLFSLHGRKKELGKYLGKVTVGLLLSGGLTEFAKTLEKAGVREIILGENLSYPDEKITRMRPEELETYDNAELSVMIIPKNDENT